MNKVELSDTIDGSILLPWAEMFRDLSAKKTKSSQFFKFAESVEAYKELEVALREVPVDLTQFSKRAEARVMRQLAELPGLADFLSCASDAEREGVERFIEGFCDFIVQNKGKAFPLSQHLRAEQLPLMCYWLMKCAPDEQASFWQVSALTLSPSLAQARASILSLPSDVTHIHVLPHSHTHNLSHSHSHSLLLSLTAYARR